MIVKQRGWYKAGWARIVQISDDPRNQENPETAVLFLRITKDDDYNRDYDASVPAAAFGEVATTLAKLSPGDAFYFEGFEETRIFNKRDTGLPAAFQRLRIENVFIPRDRQPDYYGTLTNDKTGDLFDEPEAEDPFA